jgi:hypothetical protein
MVAIRKPTSKTAVAAAISGDLSVLVAGLQASHDPEGTGWDQAISQLWRTYHRETAAALVVQAAQHSDADIIQYWIARFIEVETDIARETFSQEFLAEHFQPEVASRCGRRGCC